MYVNMYMSIESSTGYNFPEAPRAIIFKASQVGGLGPQFNFGVRTIRAFNTKRNISCMTAVLN